MSSCQAGVYKDNDLKKINVGGGRIFHDRRQQIL